MELLKLNLGSSFIQGILSRIIAKSIRKKCGCDVDILINKLTVTTTEGRVSLYAEVGAEASNEDLIKLIKSVGLD